MAYSHHQLLCKLRYYSDCTHNQYYHYCHKRHYN